MHSTQPERNSRIDYILTSSNLVEFIVNSDICTAPTPDHKAVHTSLGILKSSQGRGLWKLNNAILDEDDYKVLIQQLIAETKAEYFRHIPNPKLFDLIKLRMEQNNLLLCEINNSYPRIWRKKLNGKKNET